MAMERVKRSPTGTLLVRGERLAVCQCVMIVGGVETDAISESAGCLLNSPLTITRDGWKRYGNAV